MAGAQHRFMTFGDLVDAHQKEILRYLVRLTGNLTDAEDLFQDTFLRAFAAFHRLRAGSNRRAWVYRIATNTFLNHRRTTRRRTEVALSRDLADAGPSQSALHDASILETAIHRAMARLPRRQRAAFVQRNLQGFSYNHIAAVLGCSPAAARANVYQAVRRLRRELGATGARR